MAPERPGRTATDPARRQLLQAAGGLALSGGVAAGGCSLSAGRDHTGPDAPRALPLPQPPRLAWVFSAGGPRGFVHVGVLKALTELGLRPDLIAGASVGALVGTLWAAGRSAASIEALALDLQPLAMARVALGAQERFSGEPLAALVNDEAPVDRLERMPTPMAVVAYRRDDDAVVPFTAGNAGVAVMASAAVEGQFAPVRIRGAEYVDADWHQPLPVRTAKALGARRVLAVDATVHLDRSPPGAERYRSGDLRKQALVQADARLADLVLKPDFGYWVSLSREFRERAIGAGYRDTMAQAARLRRLHDA